VHDDAGPEGLSGRRTTCVERDGRSGARHADIRWREGEQRAELERRDDRHGSADRRSETERGEHDCHRGNLGEGREEHERQEPRSATAEHEDGRER
jgi:hypothetical protein